MVVSFFSTYHRRTSAAIPASGLCGRSPLAPVRNPFRSLASSSSAPPPFWQLVRWFNRTKALAVARGAATAGAIIGDGLSFWIGYRYHREILERWPLDRHPDLITRSEAFFARHGDKSVFTSRASRPACGPSFP